MKRDGAEAPAEEQRQPGEQQRPADPVQRAHLAAEEPAADRLADPLEPDRDECAEEDPGGNRDGRRVSRLRPVGEQRRTDAGAERGPGDESSERQGAGDQAALVPDCTEREGEEDDDVDQVQAEFIIVRPGGATTLSPRELRVVRATRRDSQSYRRDRARLSTQRARERRRRIFKRAVPIVVIASAAFVGGAVVAAEPVAPAAQRLPRRLGAGRLRGDARRADPDAQDEYPLERFERIYTNAAETATVASVTAGEVSEEEGGALAPRELADARLRRAERELSLPIEDDQVAWAPNLVYPGLGADERLTAGPGRPGEPQSSPPTARRSRGTGRRADARHGRRGGRRRGRDADPRPGRRPGDSRLSPGSLTGTSGLELAWNQRLSGRPGGQLVAVSADEERDRGRADPRIERSGAGQARPDDDRPRAPGGGRDGARQPVRRRRRPGRT